MKKLIFLILQLLLLALFSAAAPAAQVSECPGAPPTSLKPNTLAQVSLHPPMSNNLRLEPGLQGKRIARLKPGEVVQILEGPRCADSYTWWSVRSLAGLEGWTAEGDSAAYWLHPLLDGFFYDTVKPSAASHAVLEFGLKYRVTLSGTYSLWVPQQWTDRGVCIRGPAGRQPMYPSPHKTNGPVGADPYFNFARPFYGRCQPLLDRAETISPLLFSLDGGVNAALAVPLYPKYRPDHRYEYQVTGQGHPLSIRLDDVPLDDNYGQIYVTLEKIEE